MKVIVHGSENLKGHQGFFVIASNHASYLDWVVLLGCFPTPIRFIAKKELKKIPFIGSFLANRGVLIDRKAMRSSIQKIAHAVEDDDPTPMLVFPEGTRASKKEVQPFKSAGLKVFAKNNVPIMPVALLGTFDALPRSAKMYRPGATLQIVLHPFVQPTTTDKHWLHALEAQIRSTFEGQSTID